MRIKDVLNDRYRPLLTLHYGLLKLTHERFRKIRPYEQRVIESQLQKFVELLDRGEILQMAPEGAVSLDGRFSRIRRGLHVLLNRSSADVRILPVCISYDSMDLGRPRVFLNIGKEITGLKGLMPSELSARVTQAILAQTTITASHLAGQFILDLRAAGKRVLHRKELMCYVAREAEEWVKRGMYVDPRLLNSSAREMRIKRLLEYAVQTKTLDYTAAERYLLPVSNGETARDGTDPHRAIEFVVNQIISVREG